ALRLSCLQPQIGSPFPEQAQDSPGSLAPLYRSPWSPHQIGGLASTPRPAKISTQCFGGREQGLFQGGQSPHRNCRDLLQVHPMQQKRLDPSENASQLGRSPLELRDGFLFGPKAASDRHKPEQAPETPHHAQSPVHTPSEPRPSFQHSLCLDPPNRQQPKTWGASRSNRPDASWHLQALQVEACTAPDQGWRRCDLVLLGARPQNAPKPH